MVTQGFGNASLYSRSLRFRVTEQGNPFELSCETMAFLLELAKYRGEVRHGRGLYFIDKRPRIPSCLWPRGETLIKSNDHNGQGHS